MLLAFFVSIAPAVFPIFTVLLVKTNQQLRVGAKRTVRRFHPTEPIESLFDVAGLELTKADGQQGAPFDVIDPDSKYLLKAGRIVVGTSVGAAAKGTDGSLTIGSERLGGASVLVRRRTS